MLYPILINLFALLLLIPRPHEPRGVAIAVADTTKYGRLDFTIDIEPILKAKCSPCHFHGGIKYIRMPLDDPQTIRNNSEAILKYIENPEEAAKIKAFIEQKEP